MARVQRLSEAIIRRIAAGEVIARPASVVKELVENAIDAGAAHIGVELRRGGKDLIRVTDDGWGMRPEDALLAVERYSTSKLSNLEDLEHLTTLGFRGEALAAIASVSKLRIETATEAGVVGTWLEVEEGRVREHGECARPRGTTVTVKGLFYNLPVRRGFLHSDHYELRLVVDLVRSYGLAYPEITFSLVADGRELLRLPRVESLYERLRYFLDREVFDALIECRVDNPTISLKGYLVDPARLVDSHPLQASYFNRRPVRNRAVMRVIYSIYGTERHPTFVLLFQVDPPLIDVNVHPTKEEIRFQDERYFVDFLTQALRRALSLPQVEAGGVEPSLQSIELFETARAQKFWQLHNSYIFAQVQSGYVIVDQHVAHERILYEYLLKQSQEGKGGQGLLFPILLDLSPEVYIQLGELKSVLKPFGVELSEFGLNRVMVETIPAGSQFTPQDLLELLSELGGLEPGERTGNETAKVIACKGAVKAGQPLSPEEMESLINRLFRCEDPYFCPHGRPIIIKVNMDELARKFGRS
jgi:DNA mismatch repair protein MutL